MVDPSELRSLPGMDAESWRRLGPLVSALPSGVLLNINTAPAEVLLAYVEKSSPPEMERFVLVRDQQPIRDAADPQVATLFGTATTALDVRSSFFSLQVHARYRDRHVRFETRIERDPKKGSTIITGRSDATRI
jgi:general secretion pathway protein K